MLHSTRGVVTCVNHDCDRIRLNKKNFMMTDGRVVYCILRAWEKSAIKHLHLKT